MFMLLTTARKSKFSHNLRSNSKFQSNKQQVLIFLNDVPITCCYLSGWSLHSLATAPPNNRVCYFILHCIAISLFCD